MRLGLSSLTQGCWGFLDDNPHARFSSYLHKGVWGVWGAGSSFVLAGHA